MTHANEILELEFHPLADLFPLIDGDDFEALKADIAANSLQLPIRLYQGKIIDGRNRYRACRELGIYYVTQEIGGFDIREGKKKVATDAEALAFVVSLNLHRRHLTAEQKREIIGKLLKATPQKSDRQIAETVKTDHKTVGAVRDKLEARGEIPHVEARTDSKGRGQPARRAGGLAPEVKALIRGTHLDRPATRAKLKQLSHEEQRAKVERDLKGHKADQEKFEEEARLKEEETNARLYEVKAIFAKLPRKDAQRLQELLSDYDVAHDIWRAAMADTLLEPDPVKAAGDRAEARPRPAVEPRKAEPAKPVADAGDIPAFLRRTAVKLDEETRV